MARYLHTVWPFSGHVHPNIAVARALKARGHDVAFYCGARMQSLIEGEGFEFFPFQSVDETHVVETVEAIGKYSIRKSGPFRLRDLWREWLLGTVEAQLQDLEDITQSWNPDALICDPAMWGPILILHEQRRLPVAILSYAASCILPGPDGPILGVSVPRTRSVVGRLRRRVLRNLVRILTSGGPREANEIRRRHGLVPLRMNVTAYTGTLPMYLMPSTWEFDGCRTDLPPSVQYVGPCQWDKAASSTIPAWLADLSSEYPAVYVTEGTLHVQEPIILRAALRGLADAPVQMIVTTGRNRDPRQLGLDPIPSNARVEQFIPQSGLLPRVRAVVTNGGSGTVMAALSLGIPLVVVPTAWDQPENAWRIVEAGAGIRIAPAECTPERLRAAVLRVLSEPSFRQNAERLATVQARYEGAPRAASLLEGLVRSQQGTAR